MQRRIGICGLGYVGTISAACLARDGHDVVGFDVVPAKVTLIENGVSPCVEPGLAELVAAAVKAGKLRATLDIADAVHSTDAMILCVGTPTASDETPDLRFVASAAARIGAALQDGRPYTLLMRSTVPPGTIEDLVIPELERASRRLVSAADGLRVLAVPEFLREACAIADFDDPPFIIVGAAGLPSSADRSVIEDLFRFPDRVRWVDYRTAELLKCVCNAWHATKTIFANEVGALCTALGINGGRLMELLCADHKLNTSAAYLRPGGPFGGSCLPKDLRALVHLSRRNDLPSLLLNATLQSNQRHIADIVARIERIGAPRVGLHGLSFKPGTDDLRESPMVAIANALLELGFDVRIYDEDVMRSHAQTTAADSWLCSLLVETPADLLRHAQLVVLRGKSEPLMTLVRGLAEPPVILELGKEPLRPAPAPAASTYTDETSLAPAVAAT
jgi:GDP-mannose 6-dehydrogenase